MRDHTIPDGQWVFDEAVTAVFDDMLERSIPQYEVMRDAVTSIATTFAHTGDTILDIGCSNGLGLEQIVDMIGDKCNYIGVEISEPMIAHLNNLYVSEYLDMKARNGYSQEEIDRKRYSLEGILVPLTAQWNEQMLRAAGFKYTDCFWRWMNFAGWVAIR